MRFHLKSIILWPRNDRFPPRVLSFQEGKLNVITGASKTGKSAVIPIIDYCLGSEMCAIPVKTIRDACSWFGVVVETRDGEKLLARREPGGHQSTGEMFVLEGATIDIPQTTPQKNTNVDATKRLLDGLAGLSDLGFDPSGFGGGFQGRPSFRDLLAFAFQPQNIVANPNVLFFRADTTEHKEKLKTIFPYVLGAITPEHLARRWEIDQLAQELRRKERELTAQDRASEQWLANLQRWVSEATTMGLLEGQIGGQESSRRALLEMLQSVVRKTSDDTRVTESSLDEAAREVVELDREEAAISADLASVKARLDNMTRLRSAVDEYSGALAKQRERLQLSTWLHDLSEATEGTCPVCGGAIDGAAHELEVLCAALASVEETARQLDPIPAAFDKELVEVRQGIRALTDRLTAAKTRRAAIQQTSQRIREDGWRRAAVDRFIGRMEQALEALSMGDDASDLAKDVAELKARLDDLKQGFSEKSARERQAAALKQLSAAMARILPGLEVERPNDAAELDITELTIRVTGDNGRQDYLWEIGSGANWLAYHVACMLALQSLFMGQKASPVPSMLVLDQPSQVYFPRKLAGAEESTDLHLKDEDVEAVKSVFRVLAQSTEGGAAGLQVLVLDHAGSDVWGQIEGIHLVEEWRGQALVPDEWLRSVGG